MGEPNCWWKISEMRRKGWGYYLKILAAHHGHKLYIEEACMLTHWYLILWIIGCRILLFLMKGWNKKICEDASSFWSCSAWFSTVYGWYDSYGNDQRVRLEVCGVWWDKWLTRSDLSSIQFSSDPWYSM